MTDVIQNKKSLKQIIAEEYKKCATDPIHFMKKYCMIQHPVRGKDYISVISISGENSYRI